MFEFDQFDAGRQRSQAVPSDEYVPFSGGARSAFLLWGEHCTECAAPDCFSTCDIYDPRSDQRCRRFEFGVFKNTAFASARGYGAEVVFKRWAKLEARGNSTMLPSGIIHFFEGCAAFISPAANAFGSLAHRAFKDIRWSYVGHALFERLNGWLHARRDARRTPDAFVVELYNPEKQEIVLLLSMSVDRTKVPPSRWEQLPRPFLKKFRIPPGYYREDVPFESLRNLIESDVPYGISLMPDAAEGARLIFLTLDFVTFHESERTTPPMVLPAVAAPPRAKCVVFDLDNTLWDGVLLEGRVNLRQGILETFRELDARGILISVASKNVQDAALAQLRASGLEEYVLFPAIGWNSKSDGLCSIARQLNIGLDTLIFVDDSAFERDEVARLAHGVEVLPDTAVHTLAKHPRLQGCVTEEARTRRLMYRQAEVRQYASAAAGDDYEHFLRSCEISVEVRPDTIADAERIAELVQRTNQLNFSGRKYSRNEIERILQDVHVERYVISCSDRYGSYGIVGFCLARRTGNELRIDDLMLSCRVQGKLVEQALLHHLCVRPDWCASAVEVNFIGTERNAPARAVLDKLNFRNDGSGMLRRELQEGDLLSDVVQLSGSYAGLGSGAADITYAGSPLIAMAVVK